MQRKSVIHHFDQLFINAARKPQELWNSLRPLMHSKRCASSEYITLKENNRIIKDQAQVIGILYSHFKNVKPWKSNSSLASSEINHTCQIFQGNWNQNEPFEFNLINHKFNLVKTTIQRLKVNKAPGHDHIPPRALKASIPSIARHLSHLILENCHHFETSP